MFIILFIQYIYMCIYVYTLLQQIRLYVLYVHLEKLWIRRVKEREMSSLEGEGLGTD